MEWYLIDPGKPQQNAFVERCNGSLRDEGPSEVIFGSPDDARRKSEVWRSDSNHVMPRSSLGGLPPL